MASWYGALTSANIRKGGAMARASTPADRSGIRITRIYEVECRECDIIVDQPRTYPDAIAARRDHFQRFHQGQQPSTGSVV
jgi:hypothetical protein